MAIKKIAIYNFDFAKKNIVAASLLNQPVAGPPQEEVSQFPKHELRSCLGIILLANMFDHNPFMQDLTTTTDTEIQLSAS